MKKYFVIFCFFISSVGFAQKPCFTLSSNRICAGSSVTVTDCSNGGKNIIYQYDPVGNPKDTVAAPSHIYTKPGTYKIVQWGSFNAQGDSTSRIITVLPLPDPVFTVGFCPNNKVSVTITDTIYDYFYIDFGDGTPTGIKYFKGAVIQHTYINGNPRKIELTGNYSIGCGQTANKDITPLSTIPSSSFIQLKTPSSTSFEMAFNVENYLRYQVLQQNELGVEQVMATFEKADKASQAFTATNLDSTQTYRFRIKALTDCGESIYSGQVAKIPLSVQSLSQQMQVSWKPYPVGTDFVNYQLFRNGVSIFSSTDINATSFTDNDIVCGRKYCYQLKVQLLSGLTSFTQILCKTGISTIVPQAVINANATIQKEKAVLSWEPAGNTTIKNYNILATTGTIYNTNKNSLEDTTRFNKQICYKIYMEDSCGNRSPEINICPVFLAQEAKTGALVWTAYMGGQGGAQEYFVEKLDEGGQVLESISAGTALEFRKTEDFARQILYYRIKVISGSLSSFSNVISYVQTIRLTIPTAFSPNDDQINDTFMAEGIFIKVFNMAVFDRWGKAVFSTTDINKGWDGKINNLMAPAGSYVYTVETQDFTGKVIKRQGTFMLLR
jgi:gliding motility-associated-like protein